MHILSIITFIYYPSKIYVNLIPSSSQKKYIYISETDNKIKSGYNVQIAIYPKIIEIGKAHSCLNNYQVICKKKVEM